jgi:hypothetical protein
VRQVRESISLERVEQAMERNRQRAALPAVTRERERERNGYRRRQTRESEREAKENISKQREGQVRESHNFLGARRTSKRQTKAYAALRRWTTRQC